MHGCEYIPHFKDTGGAREWACAEDKEKTEMKAYLSFNLNTAQGRQEHKHATDAPG